MEKVLRLVSQDPRITVLSEVMSRERVVGLQSVCDCFVSLHRAEGFGRNIAEAMLLGKPVVVSAFSGNMDFTNEETAFLVHGDLILVRPGEYPFHEGQVWLDPDLEAAADAMRRVADDPTERNRRGAKGPEMVSARYSPEAVGRRYFERLKLLAPASI
jgi:glycosyltransferase involved in cell wall biosynthesis